MSQLINNLYPECEIFHQGHLKVSDLHQIYYEQCGNPEGIPVIFLHGGPGSGCSPTQRRFFDPHYFHIILFDQRGCGRSLPLGETNDNHTPALIADMESLRAHLGIKQWHVFGGSWGSTLALAYALVHTPNVLSLTLRGIFLSRAHELRWFLQEVVQFFPEVWHKLANYLPANERGDVLQAYASRVFNADKTISIPAATSWNAFESSILSLLPRAGGEAAPGEIELARARVQIHYILSQCFVDGAAILQQAASQLAHVPTTIVQGRYDMVCPPQTAWELAQAMPHAQYKVIDDAGHSAMETGIANALVEATNALRAL